MSRMIDRLLTSNVHKPYGVVKTESTWRKIRDDALKELAGAQVIEISNVSDYLWEGTTQEVWDLEADFPNVAPPFPSFWMEYHTPSKIVSTKGTQDVRNFGLTSVGLLCHAETMDDIMTRGVEDVRASMRKQADAIRAEHLPRINRKLSASGLDPLTATQEDVRAVLGDMDYSLASQYISTTRPGDDLDDDALAERAKTMGIQWGIRMTCFMEVSKGTIVGPVFTFIYAADGTGKMIHDTYGIQPIMDTEMIPQDAWGMKLFTFPALLALSLLHCKNVTLETTDPPAKLSKAFQRRNGRPLVRYHTLNIEPMRRVLKHEGQSEKTGLRKAMHICRGHFKDYSKHGLFGKYKGMYWWESHVRGSADEGAVLKDYNVTTPKQA